MNYDLYALFGKMCPDCSLPTTGELSPTSSWDWPTSGLMAAGELLMLSSSESPNSADGFSDVSLAAILEPNVAPKYSLSPKACAGVLRRAAKRGRELPPLLLAALQTVASTLPADDKKTTPTSSSQPTANSEAGTRPTKKRKSPARSAPAAGEPSPQTLPSSEAGTRQDFDTENFVLMQEVAVGCQAPDGYPKGREDGLAYTLTARPQRGHGASLSVCVTVPVTHSLTAEGADASEDGTGRGTPIVFNWQSGGDCRLNAGSLPDALSVGQTPAVHVGPVVRRLTPLECERLMGWPDDHTKFRADGSVIADGPRYRLCGNGVVGTVSRWLAERLGRFVFAERRAA